MVLVEGLDLILVHDGITVAVQVTGVINPWGKVILTGVERRVIVHHWKQTTMLRNDRKGVRDGSTHQDHDTMRPSGSQRCKDPD